MSYRYTPAARQEFSDAVQWYLAEGGPIAAELFAYAVDRALRLLVRMPKLGRQSYPGARTWPLKDFPYTLVYRTEREGISVIAVAHQSRAPGYWTKPG